MGIKRRTFVCPMLVAVRTAALVLAIAALVLPADAYGGDTRRRRTAVPTPAPTGALDAGAWSNAPAHRDSRQAHTAAVAGGKLWDDAGTVWSCPGQVARPSAEGKGFTN